MTKIEFEMDTKKKTKQRIVEEVNNSSYRDMIFNYLLDQRKKEIDYFERAKIISHYLKDNGLSQRELASQLGIPHNTLQDWLLWTKITKKQYDGMKDKGMTDTAIYRVLRNGKSKDANEIIKSTQIDYELEIFLKKARRMLSEPEFSPKTLPLIAEIQNYLNRLAFRVEQESKK